MEVSYEKALPPEQWWQVLVNLSPEDLCSVIRTSSYMKSLASLPNLWSGMEVNMRKVRDNGLAQLYSIDRFKKVRKMNFRGLHFSSEKLKMVFHDIPASNLEDINLSRINLRQVPAELLANAVSHLQTVNLLYSGLSTEQCIQVLEASLSSESLVDVNLSMVNLSGVPADLLARAVSRLQTVNLSYTNLTTEQCTKVLEASLSSKSLVHLNLNRVNLSGVPSHLLAMAVSRLQTVNLSSTRLSTQQCIQVLEVSLSSRSLVEVNLSGVNLSEVPSFPLARAVSRLQTVNLSNTNLTTEQCIQVLEVSLSSRSLVNVNLYCVNLSEVPADLLARGVSRLQIVTLSPGLTTEQCIQVLEVSLSSRSLVDVNLGHVNLSGVPSDLLARAIFRLQTVNLTYTELTTDQCIQVLEASLSSGTLIDVNLGYVILNGVPSDLLAGAVSRLKIVNLLYTNLTTEQCIQVLEVSLSSKSLLDVNLGYVDLSGVPADLLAMAVSRLQTVDLQITELTTEQCIKVVEASISSKTLINVDIHGNGDGLQGVPEELLAQAGRNLKKPKELLTDSLYSRN